MSICDQIKYRHLRQEILLLEPYGPGSATKRKLYVTPDFHKFLTTKQPNKAEEDRRVNLRTDFDTYISGDELSVRLRYRQGSNSQMARLENPSEEVWEFQVRGRRPQSRAIGRFACRNTFIAFFWKLHDELKSKKDWAEAKARCQSEWASLFFPSPAHSGVEVDDYLSNGVLVGNSGWRRNP